MVSVLVSLPIISWETLMGLIHNQRSYSTTGLSFGISKVLTVQLQCSRMNSNRKSSRPTPTFTTQVYIFHISLLILTRSRYSMTCNNLNLLSACPSSTFSFLSHLLTFYLMKNIAVCHVCSFITAYACCCGPMIAVLNELMTFLNSICN